MKGRFFALLVAIFPMAASSCYKTILMSEKNSLDFRFLLPSSDFSENFA